MNDCDKYCLAHMSKPDQIGDLREKYYQAQTSKQYQIGGHCSKDRLHNFRPIADRRQQAWTYVPTREAAPFRTALGEDLDEYR